jgi:serine/threonine-protein kinase
VPEQSSNPGDQPTVTARVSAGEETAQTRELGNASATDPDIHTATTEIDGPAQKASHTGSRGLIIGRYVVLGRLGSGGMGVVYRAYDPELDRRVALKLLRVRKSKPERVALARERLLREAQALAQLSHPNVVSVYDTGNHGDEVFVAMELVEGDTLKTWLRGEKRSLSEILDVFIQAGRGLAAAHRAGLIHRDFKPGNVMVGDDGVVRVLDFGLARAAEIGSTGFTETLDPSDDDSDALESAEHRLQAQLTRAGAVMGTPAYMSPEQHLGLEVDELADQFSFCVALYEAVYGQRPFAGSTRQELREEIVDARRLEPPTDTKLPSWLRRVIERGMSPKASQRYASMEAVLAELERDRGKVWRWAGFSCAALVLVGFGILGMTRASSSERMCKGSEAELAGVWDDGVEATVRSRFAASKRSHAEGTFRRVVRILDRYRAQWISMHRDACTSTRVRGTQSEAMLDRRMHCLNVRREELRALTTLFAADADGEVVDRAVRASLSLAPVSDCADEAALTAAVPPPADPTTRKHVAELRKRIFRASALQKAARYKEALELARTVAKEATRLGYSPLQIQADYRLASIEYDKGDAKRAEAILHTVVDRAAQVKDDSTIALAWVELIGIIGVDRARQSEALALQRAVENMVVRAGDPPPLRATFHGNIATILWARGRYEDAIREHRKAIAIRETSLPAGHPDLATSFNNLANVYYEMGRYEEARRYYRKAIPIWEKALGVDHPQVSLALMNLGNVAAQLREFDRANELHDRALAIKEKLLGKNHPRVATSLSNLAELLKKQGRWKRALELQHRALSIWKKSLGPEHPHTAVGLHNLGNTFFAQDKYAEARDKHIEALRIFEKSLGKDHPYVAHALTGLGKAERHLGNIKSAIGHLERALEIRLTKKVSGFSIAHTRFSLARALWLQRGSRARALDLARKAYAGYVAAGKAGVPHAAEVAEWLAKQGYPLKKSAKSAK